MKIKLRIAMINSICSMMLLMFFSLFSACDNGKPETPVTVEESDTTANGNTGNSETYLKTNDPVSAIANHPAFAGFGRYLMPWDDRNRNYDMPITQVASTMPYHNYIRPQVVVDAVNYMIDEVNAGKTIFYDFYSPQAKSTDASKENAGLLFFRGNPGAPFVIICPGGGFSYVGSLHAGFPIAVETAKKGYNAFVLKYRTGGAQRATEDLAAAITFIYENAETLAVSRDGYSVWGGSAGARMAAAIGTDGIARYGGGDNVPKPAMVVIAYTGHFDYSSDDPPTFTMVGENDGIASPATMERRVNALRNVGVDVEFHLYPGIGHGFALGTGTIAEGWLDLAIRFWKKHITK